MRHVDTIVIGAGQAGLAVSHCLSERGISHMVVERGDIANSWATERWDSLRLLTPNWQSRLPGHAYQGDDPDGFMSMPQVTSFLRTYADRGNMPVQCRTHVLSVSAEGQGYRVLTNRGSWRCRNVVLANGACALPNIPRSAAALPEDILQLSPLDYRSPDQLPEGHVLIVGASASGVQIADELRASGREVTLAAGHHIRVPRHYRGRDIQWWMDRSGMLDQGIADVDDITRARAVPSLQLVGNARLPFLDINYLQQSGVTVTGRLTAIRDGQAVFSGGLANACDLSDLKMRRLLSFFDDWAQRTGLTDLPSAAPTAPTLPPNRPVLNLDLRRAGVRTVLWATGFRPDFSWLHMPVFDRKGRLIHDQGRVTRGLYVLGLPFLRTRKSSLIDGVGQDAMTIADTIARRTGRLVA